MRPPRVWPSLYFKTRTLGIRAKILGIALSLILLLGLSITYQVRRSLATTLQEQLEKRGVSIARDVAARSADLVLTNNAFALHELLRDTVENNDDVRYVFITDPSGKVVVHTFGDAFPAKLAEANAVSPTGRYRLEILDTEEGLIRDVAVPVFEGRAGTARVGMSERHLREMIDSTTWQLLVSTAAVSAVAIVAAYFLTRVVTRPILDLVEVTKEVAKGNLSRKARLSSRDEIGELGQAFNTMTESLTRSQREIADYNLELLQRNRELSAVNAVAEATSQPLTLEEMLSAALSRVLDVTDLKAGWVFLAPSEGQEPLLVAHAGLSAAFALAEGSHTLAGCVCARVLETREVCVVADLAAGCTKLDLELLQKEGIIGHASVPLISRGAVLGIMNLASNDPGRFSAGQLRILDSLGKQIGVALDNSRLWEELKHKEELRAQLLVKVITAQEEERKRIARELHDETGQALTSLMVGLRVLEESRTLDELKARAAELRELTMLTLEEVHDLAIELRPSTLDDLGLIPALDRYAKEYARKHGIEVDLDATGLGDFRLAPERETAIYRIVQEALTNIAKHAGARNVSVLVALQRKRFVVIVEDDGEGFDPEAVLTGNSGEKRLGLFGMHERASLIGGKLTIESRAGKGTTVFVELPPDDWIRPN